MFNVFNRQKKYNVYPTENEFIITAFGCMAGIICKHGHDDFVRFVDAEDEICAKTLVTLWAPSNTLTVAAVGGRFPPPKDPLLLCKS